MKWNLAVILALCVAASAVFGGTESKTNDDKPARAEKTKMKASGIEAPTKGYSGAGYSLDHLVQLYQYPLRQGRPTLTFGSGEPVKPTRATKQPESSRTAPGRLAQPKGTRAGPSDIAAPAPPPITCTTDDAVEKNTGGSSGSGGTKPKDGPGAAYDLIAAKTGLAPARARAAAGRTSRSAGGAMTPRSSGQAPAIHRYPEIVDCPSKEKAELREAWEYAHDYIWAANEMLTFIDYAYPAWRPLLWKDGYDAALDDAETGGYNAIDEANWSPRAWFGSYDGERLSRAQNVVSELWWRIRNEDIRLDCDLGPGVQGEGGIIDEDTWSGCQQQNPGGGGSPDAYHFPKGKIAVCSGAFDKSGTGEYRTRRIARLLIHEMTHWIKFEDGAGNWVTDAHTIWCNNEGPKTNHICHWANDKMYGPEDVVHLASKHTGYSYRNTDNFAYFIWRLGRSVKEGHLRTFPTSWEGYPPPPWSPPAPSQNVCSVMMDDIPGNDPGVDICEGLKGQDFDSCKGSVTGKLPPLCR